MSAKTSEPILWPGGEHIFAMGIKELRALQQRCDAGPEHVAERLMGLHGGWRVDDILQPLRLGLVGGGLAAPEAGRLVEQAFEEKGPAALKIPAYVVLMACITGPADDEPGGEGGGGAPGEAAAGEDGSPSLAERSDSPNSTAPGS